MMKLISDLLILLQLLVSLGTICTMLVAVKKLLNKPEVTQNDRLDRHDVQILEIEKRLNTMENRLNSGAEHFKQLDKSTAITQKALVTIMDSLVVLMPESTDGEKLKETIEVRRSELVDYLTFK